MEAGLTDGGEVCINGVVQSLADGYATVILTQEERYDENLFPKGSLLRFPIDEPIQTVLDEEGIQPGDFVVGSFLNDSLEPGDPPTVWMVSFGLQKWTMTGELLDFSEDFFLIKPCLLYTSDAADEL